jgi:hypothetical protein
MTFFAFSALFNFFLSFILGSLIFIKDHKKQESRIFSYWAFSFAFWSFGYYFWQISTTASSALFWCRFLTVGSIFIPILYFHLVSSLLKLTDKNKILLYLSYVFALFLSAMTFTTYMVKEVKPKLFFDFWPVAGSLYLFFLAWFFGLFIYSWTLLYFAAKNSSSESEKKSLKFLLFGVFLGAVSGSTNFPLWYDIPIAPWGNIGISILLSVTAAALIKYRLLNVKTIFTEILVAVMGVILATFPFFMPDSGLKTAAASVFFFYCFIGYLLIKATYNEVAAKEGLEQRVAERTQELEASKKVAEERATELEKWYKLTIGRELRMAELKDKIKDMETKTPRA